jgi:hypothetical protein
METENLILDDSSQGQIIKELCELFPDVRVPVFPQALIVETIYLGDLSTLVVSSEDSESVLVADLQGNKQSDSLD